MSKTELEKLCDKLIDLYHKYSRHSKDQERDTLDPTEFKKLVEEQMPDFLKHAPDQEGVKKLFAELDKDKDNKITFEEFMALMGRFLILSHDNFHKHEGGNHGHAHHAHPH